MNRRAFLLILLLGAAQLAAAQALPARLSSQEFWDLSTELSEPDGTFRSDNLLSNESDFPDLIPDLVNTVQPGVVYLGVGPEQNFTYISVLKPKIAFIIDIRRGNLDLHLLYKALFEMSRDRADFVSRLFSKKRPGGLTARSTVQEIFDAYGKVRPTEQVYQQNLKAIREYLTGKRALPLSANDLSGVEYVLHSFYEFGFTIDYNSSSGGSAYNGKPVSYAELMTAVDAMGRARSYLSSEQAFLLLKDMQLKNLIVPVVGNFAGPQAIRAVGMYLKEKGATVSAFYLSNVEQYLESGDGWRNFCNNSLTLPMADNSTFIRAVTDPRIGLTLTMGNMITDLTLGTVSCK